MTSDRREPETGTTDRTLNCGGEIHDCSGGDCGDQQVGRTESPKYLEGDKVNQKRFPVIELFGPVIQGEGSQAGNQTMFIRFGGCDFRCGKCDSLHAVIPQAVAKHAAYLTTDDIVTKLDLVRLETGVKWVTFSGGNPCMHKLDELVERLTYLGFYINVETQGTLAPEWLTHCTTVTVSPKSMGMGEKFNEKAYRKFLKVVGGRCPVCVKVVVFSAQDLEFALQIEAITSHVYSEELPYCYNDAVHGGVAFYLSLGNPYPPVLDDDFNLGDDPSIVDPGNLVSSLLSDYASMCEEVLPDSRLKNWRFLPQLHTLVYGNEAKR